MLRAWRILTLVVAALAVCAGTARSEIVRIRIEGEVSYVDSYSTLLNDLFTVGDPVSGEYMYEADPGPGNTRTGVSDYWFRSEPYGINLTMGDAFTIQSDPDNIEFLIEILNNHTGMDAYAMKSYSNISSLPLSGGLSVGLISWQLDDYSQNALSGTSLLAEAPMLDDWSHIWGLRIYFDDRQTIVLKTQITSATVIPEPTTCLFLGLGGVLFVKRGRIYRSGSILRRASAQQ